MSLSLGEGSLGMGPLPPVRWVEKGGETDQRQEEASSEANSSIRRRPARVHVKRGRWDRHMMRYQSLAAMDSERDMARK